MLGDWHWMAAAVRVGGELRPLGLSAQTTSHDIGRSDLPVQDRVIAAEQILVNGARSSAGGVNEGWFDAAPPSWGDAVFEEARQADRQGFDSMWMGDHLGLFPRPNRARSGRSIPLR